MYRPTGSDFLSDSKDILDPKSMFSFEILKLIFDKMEKMGALSPNSSKIFPDVRLNYSLLLN